MLGAVAGDIMGSPFEFNNTDDFFFHPTEGTDYYSHRLRRQVHVSPRFTDDTVLTLAVASWLMTDREHSRKGLIDSLQKYARRYPDAGYGPMFREWVKADRPKPNKSFGNGAAMRVSPVGLYAETKDECLELAKLTAEVSHDHPEAIKGAQAIAYCVWLAKRHHTKDEIKRWVEVQFGYDLDTPLAERALELKGVVKEPILVNGQETGEFYVKDTGHFDASCQVTVPAAIRAFLEGDCFESVTRKAISVGGDSDTIAAMAASIADPFYGGVPAKFAKYYGPCMDNSLVSTMGSFETFLASGRKAKEETAKKCSSNIVKVIKFSTLTEGEGADIKAQSGAVYFGDANNANIRKAVTEASGSSETVIYPMEDYAETLKAAKEAVYREGTSLYAGAVDERTLYYESGALQSISNCESYGSGTRDQRLAERNKFLRIALAAGKIRSELQHESGYDGPFCVAYERACYPSVQTERVDLVKDGAVVDSVFIDPASGKMRMTANEVFRDGMDTSDIIAAIRTVCLDEGKGAGLKEDGEDLHIQVYERREQYFNLAQADRDIAGSKDKNLVWAVENPQAFSQKKEVKETETVRKSNKLSI